MTYRGHTYEGWHDGQRTGRYTLDGDPEPYTVDCGSVEDLDRIIKRVIDIKEGLYGYPPDPAPPEDMTQYIKLPSSMSMLDTLEEKSDHGRLDPDLEEGAPN